MQTIGTPPKLAPLTNNGICRFCAKCKFCVANNYSENLTKITRRAGALYARKEGAFGQPHKLLRTSPRHEMRMQLGQNYDSDLSHSRTVNPAGSRL